VKRRQREERERRKREKEKSGRKKQRKKERKENKESIRQYFKIQNESGVKKARQQISLYPKLFCKEIKILFINLF